MISNKYVSEYIELYESGKIQLNKERIMLLEYLQEHILIRDDLYFNEKLIEDFVKFAEKWYFPLQPFQKFLAAFVFLFYKEDNSVFYEQFLIMMARGGGKNGFISALSHFFISPLHGIPRYNISIVANSELQAKTSFKEIYDVIEANEVLDDLFYKTKVEITGNDTKSILQYHTSNAGSKDGLRDGCVIYDEIHRYENFDVVNVFSSGLGKVDNPREFFIGTDGFVREGFLDKMKERAMNILKGEDLDDPLFPFICKIDDPMEVDDPGLWEKANPMFSEPRSTYAKRLFKKVLAQFKQLVNNPSNREEFMTKRMNLPEVNLEKVVAPWEEIIATNRPIPDLQNKMCVGGLDYASIKDFAACCLLFRVDGAYVLKTHSFARKGYLDVAKLKPPIFEWAKEGHLTIVDEPSINPQHIIDWFLEQQETYALTKIIADNFRMDLLRPLFEANGLEYEIIKNPRAIHSLLAPRIEDAFANQKIIWGENPLMNWYTNNVAVKIRSDGNKEYIKKDEHRRKTDGFQAFVHAMYRADEVEDMDIRGALDLMDSLDF
ncbi:terminase TerL endonuclease subunit [Peribacillus sp. TH14]|uniref:terminase TerL endonuclease subunit n=1 Tax=Peribacillus sp. TH14 TaxID=2798481 RepID=UPI0019122B34|nr:terminase TerL endonuclease subunit [Peribacillus sp. TH14]MBK5497422.1 terminase large subunit [Peribacillus sp. TH14]